MIRVRVTQLTLRVRVSFRVIIVEIAVVFTVTVCEVAPCLLEIVSIFYNYSDFPCSLAYKNAVTVHYALCF